MEAPPWRGAKDAVSYIYKPNDGEYAGGLLGPIVQAVGRHLGREPPDFVKKDATSKAAVLAWLGQQGVLLIDPLPFALSYTKLSYTRLPLPGGRAVAVAEETHCFAQHVMRRDALLFPRVPCFPPCSL